MGLVAGLLSGAVAVPPTAAQAAPFTPPPVQAQRSVPVRPVVAKPRPALEVEKKAQRATPKVEWPQAGSAEVDLPAPAAAARPSNARPGSAERVAPAKPALAQVGALPVRVGAPSPSGSAAASDAPPKRAAATSVAPRRVRVEVLDRRTSQGVGIDGPVLRLARADGQQSPGKVSFELDYSAFRDAFGADWDSRLRLVTLPDCALVTPHLPECRGAVVKSTNARATGRLSADLPVPAPSAGQRAAAAGTGQLVGVSSAPSSIGGNFTATQLSPSATWSAGGSTGDFNWSYPITVPPAMGSAAPQISLSYSSSNVDGRTSATNNQVSWIGTGFDFWPGFVERTFKGCANDGNQTGDLCWQDPNGSATISLNGKASELVRDDKSGEWRLKSDDGSTVERRPGAANGAHGGEHWKVTTQDGTQYYFGVNRLNRSTDPNRDTNSAWTVPVAGNHVNEPCHGKSFAESFCDQAWRMNLDHVIDVHGNTVTYYYKKEINHYGRNNGATKAEYTRGGWLDRVEYGQRTGQEHTVPAQARVLFATATRCADGAVCDPARPETFADTPLDLTCDKARCDQDVSPTFWTAKRLKKITTEVRDGAGYRPVDSWTLRHSFPARWDKTKPSMWLIGITRSGLSGPTPVTLPEVVFDGQELPNRVGTGSFAEPMYWWRMKTVRNEYGGGLTVTYSDADCSRGDVPNASNNNRRCYPTYWKPEHYPEVVLDWFHKYVVKAVVAFDGVAEAATTTTEYRYPNAPAWHYDDYDGISDQDHRTWSQWRGYDVVETIVGTGEDGPRTSSETLYMRGMDGDRTGSGAPRPPVKVKDADNVEILDQPVLQGFVRQQITRKGVGGPVLSRTVNDPWVSEPTAVAKHRWGPAEARVVDTGSVRNFTALAAGGWRKVQVDKTFDKFGVVTQINDLGDVNAGDDDKCTRLHYAPPGTARWLPKVPYRSETVAVPCGTTPSRPNDVISDVHTYYDGSEQLGATPARGVPTRVDELVEYQGDKPRYATKSRVVHDEFGRPKDSWDANGKKTHTSYTHVPGSRVTSVAVTNPLGHTTTTELDTARGLPVSQVDANSRRTEMAYDALGRLIKGWLPGRAGKPGVSPNAEFAYQVVKDKPVAVETRALNAHGGYISTFEILDGLLRPRQKQIPAPGGGRVLTDTFFDSRGLTVKANAGYFNKDAGPGAELRKATDVEVPAQTVTEYDGAGQPTAQIFRAGGIEKWRSTMAYGGDRVHATPPAGGTATTTISDARGRTTELHQYHGATPTGDKDITKYRYDRRGHLAEVIDPAGNTWGYKHDLAGRLIESRDPDKGTSTLSYNDAGQLLTSTDARKTTLAYGYDDLGRQTELRDGSATGPLRTKTVYDTLPGGVGLPTSATRYVDGSEYTTGVTEYDRETGRPMAQFTSIPISERGLADTYTFPVTYNVDGSVQTLSMFAKGDLPTEFLTFGYNELNLPSTLRGRMEYVSASSYTEFSEPAQYLMGAEKGARHKPVSINYTYQDATRRLEQILVSRGTEPTDVANIKYSYDPAGNITKIADTPGSRQHDVQCFTYDHLRRMTEAWTPASKDCDKQRSADALGGAAPYWQSYRYDVTGNRTELTNHTKGADVTKKYAYPDARQPRPHALASVTTTTNTGTTGAGTATPDNVERFEYDETGNTKTRTAGGSTQILDWDAEGRLAKTVEGDKQTSYVYDAAGNRLLRRDPTGTTLYLPGHELKADANGENVVGTRFYSHNGSTIASRVGDGDITWLAGDHQGTSQIAIDQFRGQAITRRYQTPFGESRGPAPAWPNEKGFVGGTLDIATRLVHIGAREYDPGNGRFISVDPIIDPLDPQQMNGYAYSNNSPVTFADPDGLAHIECLQAGTSCRNGKPTGEPAKPKPTVPPPPPEVVEQARQISNRSVMDVIADVGGEVLKEVVGVNDFVDCFTKGSVMGCINTAINVIPWAQLAKVGKLAKAIKRVWEAVETFRREVSWAQAVLRQADLAAEAAKRAGSRAGATVAAKADDAGKAAGEGAEAVAKKAPASCTHSFDRNTKVLMADGSYKAIKDVKRRDKVKATNPKTGKTRSRTVTKVHLNLDTDLVDLKVRTADGATVTLHTTAHHPFWNATDRRWTNAADLEVGERLRTTDGGATVTVQAVHAFTSKKWMYDLTVRTTHTYYVVAGNTPVLVHNCDTRIASSDQGRAHNAAAFEENGHNGFSGVYDPISDTFHARVSGGDNPLVDRFGGHGQINGAVFGGSRNTIGFVAIRGEDGMINMKWNSASVNVRNFGSRAAPMPWRDPIMNAIRRATGLEVVG